MATVPRKQRLTVDEFMSWAEEAPGRHELVAGEIVAMSPERVRHAETKFAVQVALAQAVRTAGIPCRVLPDGMTVRVDDHTAYQPDALVYCGERLSGDVVEVANATIVVEVLSPGTRGHDTGGKLTGYFTLPSIEHYLIVDPSRRVVVHHRRGAGGVIETRIVPGDSLLLDPPGLSCRIADLFPD